MNVSLRVSLASTALFAGSDLGFGRLTMPGLPLINAKITRLDRARLNAETLAVLGAKFLAVGNEAEVRAAALTGAAVIDTRGRRLVPGLIDSHIHVLRGGLNYNMALRCDGVPTLAGAEGARGANAIPAS